MTGKTFAEKIVNVRDKKENEDETIVKVNVMKSLEILKTFPEIINERKSNPNGL